MKKPMFNLFKKKLHPWDLSAPLLDWGCVHLGKKKLLPWTVGESFEGLQVFGGTGSGKTSGTGKKVASSFMKRGFGGLVLCAKADEAQNWVKMAKEYGREQDIVLFSPEQQQAFNFLNYAMNFEGRGSGSSESVISMLFQIIETQSQSQSDIWEKAMKQLLRNCLDLISLAQEQVTLSLIYQLATDPSKASSMLDQADGFIIDGSAQDDDLTALENFFEKEWVEMAQETKGSILMNLTAVVDPFLRGAIRETFCKGTTIDPSQAQDGKIIIIDMPIKEFNELGRYASIIWKYAFQNWVERRSINEETRPCFIFADESQFFVTKADAEFQTTARSSRCSTVYLTQNLPNYLNATGGTQQGKNAIDSLLGNLQTKIFHQNGDSQTNDWASKTIGKELTLKISTSTQTGGANNQGGVNTSTSEQLESLIQPNAFSRLLKGGEKNQFIVTAYLYQSGVSLLGEPFKLIAFNQKNI